MIRIGEKLNSSLAAARDAMTRRDEIALAAIAQAQVDAGADWLDINAAIFREAEGEVLCWAIQTVQRATGAHVMIDSPNPAVVAAALKADSVGHAIVNSVTQDAVRLDTIAPLLLQYNASVVALAMGEKGTPPTADGRLDATRRVLGGLAARGIPQQRVYVDPLVETLATNHESAQVTLATIRLIRQEYPEANILCGLSNVSFGLPKRKAVNSAFLIAAIIAGANAAILDAADPDIRQAIATAEALSGHDEYCMEYIRYCRANG